MVCRNLLQRLSRHLASPSNTCVSNYGVDASSVLHVGQLSIARCLAVQQDRGFAALPRRSPPKTKTKKEKASSRRSADTVEADSQAPRILPELGNQVDNDLAGSFLISSSDSSSPKASSSGCPLPSSFNLTALEASSLGPGVPSGGLGVEPLPSTKETTPSYTIQFVRGAVGRYDVVAPSERLPSSFEMPMEPNTELLGQLPPSDRYSCSWLPSKARASGDKVLTPVIEEQLVQGTTHDIHLPLEYTSTAPDTPKSVESSADPLHSFPVLPLVSGALTAYTDLPPADRLLSLSRGTGHTRKAEYVITGELRHQERGPELSVMPGEELENTETDVKEAKQMLRHVLESSLSTRLEADPRDCISTSELLQLCRESGAASTEAEAAELLRALDRAGDVLLFRNRVFLHPTKISQLMASVLPVPPADDKDPRWKELAHLESEKAEIDEAARRAARRLAMAGYSLITSCFLLFFRLTFWELSWDVMEPISFFVTTGGAITAGYTYFLVTSTDMTYKDVHQRVIANRLRRIYKDKGFDAQRYDDLRNELMGGIPLRYRKLMEAQALLLPLQDSRRMILPDERLPGT